MTTEAARIIAAPVPVTLAGQEYGLLFDFEALMWLEEDFGGILSFIEQLNGTWRGPRMKAVKGGLRAGLAHTGLPADEVRRLTSSLVGPGFTGIASVIEALSEAFYQAIPPPASSATPEDAAGKASAQATVSPGQPSTDAPPS